MPISRRTFLMGASGAGVIATLGGLSPGLGLRPVSAQETAITPDMVRFSDDIEPIVRLIEETPRDTCVEVLAQRVQQGLSYNHFLAALFLAGIRNVNPQPPGFKFHCVFVMHSANYLAQLSPPEERLLPLFYALDEFKSSQQDDITKGDFVLRETQGTLPSADKAWDEFRAAMDSWDEPRADRAITALARGTSVDSIFDRMWAYGARDYRNIGHKAIYVANSWRTLQTIGIQHAEPNLRSMALGLLDFGKDEVVNAYAYSDQCFLANDELAGQTAGALPGTWADSGSDETAVLELLDALRHGQTTDACAHAASSLASGKVQAGTAWDAAHLMAGELMMRQPGIAGVHAVTSLNALHFGFRTAADPRTRLMLLLQGLGWMGQFRRFMDPKKDKELDLARMEPEDVDTNPANAVASILDAVSKDRPSAARQAFSYARAGGDRDLLFQGARHLVLRTTSDVHEYKWLAAVFEDAALASPRWQPHMLAASTYYLRGSGHPDSPVIQRALEATKTA